MIIEKSILSSLVDKFISTNCSPLFPEESEFKFKTYLKKDENNCFTVIDKENSIKCLFDKQFLQMYFSTYPSYVKLEHYEGTLIMIKKAFFDVLFYKNVNKTISYRIILIIKEFDLDAAQKMSNEIANAKYKNVNFEPKIEQKMKIFYYNYLKSKIEKDDNNNNILHHLSLNAENFIKNKYNPDRNYGSVMKILPKGKTFCFLNSKNEDDYANLKKNEDSESFTIKEIEIEDIDDQFKQDKKDALNDNITIENLHKLDVKSLFYQQPSQKEKENKDFSHYELVDLKQFRDDKLIGSKRERVNDTLFNANSEEREDLEKMPVSIQNLIKKMENQPPLNVNIFEKYKNYKKFNSNEYTKDKI